MKPKKSKMLACAAAVGMSVVLCSPVQAGWFDRGDCRSKIREGVTKYCTASSFCWKLEWCGDQKYTLRGHDDRFISQCAVKYSTDRYGNKKDNNPQDMDYICQFRDNELIIVWQSILYYHAVWKAEGIDTSEERDRLENR